MLLNLLFTSFSNKKMTDSLKFEHISNTTQNFTRVLAVYPETTFPAIRKDKKKIESI